MPHASTEDPFIEQPAKAWPPSSQPSPRGRGSDGVFPELCWTTVSSVKEAVGQPSLRLLTNIATIDELRDISS